MQAAVWHARHDVRVESLPEPSEPGPGEVLLEVAYCGICGTDLHEYLDGPQFLPHDERGARPPAILGHEFSGTVAALGPEVTRVQVGQRVAVHPALYCGQCRFCRSGMVQLCPNASWVGLGAASGGLAGWALLKEYQLFPLPEQVSLLQGALVEPTSVTMHAVTRGGVQPGDVVLVTGGGPIGQLAALNARAAGAREVYLAEVVPGRRELAARNAEPTRVLDPRQESVVEAMRSATEAWGSTSRSSARATSGHCSTRWRRHGRMGRWCRSPSSTIQCRCTPRSTSRCRRSGLWAVLATPRVTTSA